MPFRTASQIAEAIYPATTALHLAQAVAILKSWEQEIRQDERTKINVSDTRFIKEAVAAKVLEVRRDLCDLRRWHWSDDDFRQFANGIIDRIEKWPSLALPAPPINPRALAVADALFGCGEATLPNFREDKARIIQEAWEGAKP